MVTLDRTGFNTATAEQTGTHCPDRPFYGRWSAAGSRCSTAVSGGLLACETALMDEVAARTLGRVAANGIELAYEAFGDASAPPVVLIMGLGRR